MADRHNTFTAERWVAITASDTVNIPEIPRAIYVGVSGDAALVDSTGHVETFKSLAVGEHPYQPVRINATNTTATNIVALY